MFSFLPALQLRVWFLGHGFSLALLAEQGSHDLQTFDFAHGSRLMHCFGSSQYSGLAWKQMASLEGGESVDCEIQSRRLFQRAAMCHPLSSYTADTPNLLYLVYSIVMSRTNIEIDDALVRKARKLTRLKTKRQIVDRALELLVRSEARKALLRHYGTGIWKGDIKASRRNRV
jgi:Arc/MetJ family transcription regulator